MNTAFAQTKVVTTIRPLHSIVSEILQDVDEPYLLMRGNVSPHDYKMKPSDLRALHQAKLILWLGPALESRLTKSIRHQSDKTRVVTLLDSDQIKLLPMRGNSHGHDHDHGHGHNNTDPHIWLSLQNAKLIAKITHRALQDTYPEHRADLTKNLHRFNLELDELNRQLGQKLKNVKTIPFMTYHDGFQYFEKEFGLNNHGAILSSPEHRPGAKRIASVQRMIREQKIACVFGEPQYNRKILHTLTTRSSARISQLDLIGANLTPGPDLYIKMMRNLMHTVESCLTGKP